MDNFYVSGNIVEDTGHHKSHMLQEKGASGSSHMFYLKKHLECECGETHSSLLVVLDDINDIEKIKPIGTHILFAGDCEEVKKAVAKKFRISTIVSTTNHQQSNSNHQSPFTNHPEDIRLIIGQGSKINYAKYIAKMMGLECIIIGVGDFLSSSVIQNNNGGFNLIKTPPHYIVPSIKDDTLSLSNSFAIATLSVLSMFEYYVVQNQKVCPLIFEKAMSISRDLISTASKTTLVTSPKLKEAILDANLKLAIINEYIGGSTCLSINGAVQTAAVFSRLSFCDSELKIDKLHSSALVLSGAVVRAYEAFLNKKIAHCPPPNNALRVEKLMEHLKIKETAAIKLVPQYVGRLELEKQNYNLELFRNGYLRIIREIKDLLGEAVHLFFRLLPDGGFEYREYADSLEVGLCLGLGADVLRGRTLLSIMRDNGVLDGVL